MQRVCRGSIPRQGTEEDCCAVANVGEGGSVKRFEVEVEIIEVREVQVWADSFDEAVQRANQMTVDDVQREANHNDFEKRVIGVRRSVESRMYR